MVKAIFGVMIEVDPAIKAIILKIDSTNHDYVIEDMDETHLLIKEDMVDLLKEKLEDQLKNTIHVEDESEIEP